MDEFSGNSSASSTVNGDSGDEPSNQHTLTEVTEEDELVSIKSFSLLNQFVSSSPDFWSCRCNKCAVTSVAHHSFIRLLNELIATSWICWCELAMQISSTSGSNSAYYQMLGPQKSVLVGISDLALFLVGICSRWWSSQRNNQLPSRENWNMIAEWTHLSQFASLFYDILIIVLTSIVRHDHLFWVISTLHMDCKKKGLIHS